MPEICLWVILDYQLFTCSRFPLLYSVLNFNFNFLKLYFCWPLCRCSKVLTKPRISSMFTLQSSLHCVASNWTTTTKLGICSQVSVCATFFDFRTDKMYRELKTDHMFFCTSLFLARTYFSFKRFVSLEVFTSGSNFASHC